MAQQSSAADTLLSGLDLEDANSIRRLIGGLQYYLMYPILDEDASALRRLSPTEQLVARRVWATVRNTAVNHPLLLESTIRFLIAAHRDDQGVLAAAKEFEGIAPAFVFKSPAEFPVEYEEAEARMRAIRGTIDLLQIRKRAKELVSTCGS
jgi:hypothetical protein